MTVYTSTYNPQQFELREYTNPYLSQEQSDSVNLVQDRVNQQLNWLAQMLGWNGPEYWGNLATTVAQKRRVLGGSFGVYNSFFLPKVFAVRNWDASVESSTSPALLQREIFQNQQKLWIVVVKDDRIDVGQELFIGDYNSTITSVTEEGENYVLTVEGDVATGLSNFQAGSQVKIASPEQRPAPFYRPNILTAGDETFSCVVQGSNLELYPIWDTQASLPYKFGVLMVGSTYWFDQPVYLSRDTARVIDGDIVQYPQDVVSTYDPNKQQWYLTVPPDFNVSQFGTQAFIVWLYSQTGSESFCVKQVTLKQWVDPSDWNDIEVLENFKGTWSNKGGFLPYNFVFDALEINGFDERKSLYMAPIQNTVSFDRLLNYVYYQRVSTAPVSPGEGEEGQVWWDSSDGSFSVWNSSPYRCGTWEEILYPNPPTLEDVPERVYPTVEDFQDTSEVLPPGVVIQIEDITGLSPSDDVIGVQGTLYSPAKVKLIKLQEGAYWTPLEFIYANEGDFDLDAENLPYQVPVRLEDSTDLGTPRFNYVVENLKFVIQQPLPLLMMKGDGNQTWTIRPTSNLKYIGNTRLFASNPEPVDGAMNWNYEEPNEEARRAAVYYYSGYELIAGEWVLQGAWVDVNTGQAVDPPSTSLNFGTILVYCNGELVPEGEPIYNEYFTFFYEVDALTGEFEFNYEPLNFYGSAVFPKIEISDSLTGVFRYDISDYVFSGVQYYMSPNVLDCETTLRIWKSEALQVEGDEVYLQDGNYPNVLRADENNGPGDPAWERYFVRLPPGYQRNGPVWQKVALTCQDFGYWGSSVDPEGMECPSEDDTPRIYEQVVMNNEVPTETYVMYSEPYLFSDIAFGAEDEIADFENAAILPSIDDIFDQFEEGSLVTYQPLHCRQAITDAPVGRGYGEWEGVYLRPADCADLTGHVTTDLLKEIVYPLTPPLWDSSIYKLPPSCEVNSKAYEVDVNHFKIGYAYFAADLSCAEDGFFDISQEAAWRYPSTREKTLYMTPGVKHYSLSA